MALFAGLSGHCCFSHEASRKSSSARRSQLVEILLIVVAQMLLEPVASLAIVFFFFFCAHLNSQTVGSVEDGLVVSVVVGATTRRIVLARRMEEVRKEGDD